MSYSLKRLRSIILPIALASAVVACSDDSAPWGSTQADLDKNVRAQRIKDGRWVAVPPACPDWSKPTNYDPNNTQHSNFGCADAQNLGAMIANPRDLEMGRDPGPSDGTRSAAAVERYRRDAVKQIVVVTTGSAAPSSGTAASGAGAAVGTTAN